MSLLEKRLSTPAGAKVLDDSQGLVAAFVASIGNIDAQGDAIQRGAFDASLARHLPIVARSHLWDQACGKVLRACEVPAGDPRLPSRLRAEGAGGLYVEMAYALSTTTGREAFEWVKFAGDAAQFSIGYREVRASTDPITGANLIWEIDLVEVSDVLAGASTTQLVGTKSARAIQAESLLGSLWRSGWGDQPMSVEADVARALIEADVAAA